MKIISWNIAGRDEAWRCLLDGYAEVALLQEAREPPDDVAQRIGIDAEPWRTSGAGKDRPWRTAIARLSEQPVTAWIKPKSIEAAEPGELAVSRVGSLAAAHLHLPTGEEIVVVSVYAVWESPHNSMESDWIYADASVHRIISDLSVFIGQQAGHRILVAGDFNILHGYGEEGSPYWANRYDAVFNRMSALGLTFMGPQAPHGLLADPWPGELPRDSKNVPTYHHNRQTPAEATRQLDFVFVSNPIADRIRVTAINDPDRWGPSDHCRVEI